MVYVLYTGSAGYHDNNIIIYSIVIVIDVLHWDTLSVYKYYQLMVLTLLLVQLRLVRMVHILQHWLINYYVYDFSVKEVSP